MDNVNNKANTLASIFGKAFSICRELPIHNQPSIWYLNGTTSIHINGKIKTPKIIGTTLEEVICRGYKTFVTERPVILYGDDKHAQFTEDGTVTFGQSPYQRPLDYNIKA